MLGGPKLPHGGLRKISKKWLILVSIHVDFLKEEQKCKKYDGSPKSTLNS